MKKLSMDDMEKIGGGVIVQYQGRYYAVAEDGNSWAPLSTEDFDEAYKTAQGAGFSTVPLTQEEFKDRFHHDFVPFG